MHEAGIIRLVIDTIEAEALARGAARVTRIQIRIGEIAGVSRWALEFAFDVIKRDSLAREVIREVASVRLRARCDRCGNINCPARDFNLL